MLEAATSFHCYICHILKASNETRSFLRISNQYHRHLKKYFISIKRFGLIFLVRDFSVLRSVDVDLCCLVESTSTPSVLSPHSQLYAEAEILKVWQLIRLKSKEQKSFSEKWFLSAEVFLLFEKSEVNLLGHFSAS